MYLLVPDPQADALHDHGQQHRSVHLRQVAARRAGRPHTTRAHTHTQNAHLNTRTYNHAHTKYKTRTYGYAHTNTSIQIGTYKYTHTHTYKRAHTKHAHANTRMKIRAYNRPAGQSRATEAGEGGDGKRREITCHRTREKKKGRKQCGAGGKSDRIKGETSEEQPRTRRPPWGDRLTVACSKNEGSDPRRGRPKCEHGSTNTRHQPRH